MGPRKISMTTDSDSAGRQWAVVCHAGAFSPERVHGPFDSVSEAAEKTPASYTATLLPVVNGKRSYVEDNEASALFRRIRNPLTVNQIVDRATQ